MLRLKTHRHGQGPEQSDDLQHIRSIPLSLFTKATLLMSVPADFEAYTVLPSYSRFTRTPVLLVTPLTG